MGSRMKKAGATLFAAGAIGAGMVGLGAESASAATYNGVCGSGYRVVDQHAVTGGTVFLTYNGTRNCVVTVRNTAGAKVWMVAVVGLSSHSTWDGDDEGSYSSYAGPVYSDPSAGHCIDWGGEISGSRFIARDTHCG
ncbi:hypothetical protein [Luteipulveratus halotolerans]|uniref:Spore-associated protein A n=1 Tax=Luteipulveratus halotolerans TaxID=1631356 RepID=A0A0L6CM12_9MICO|nr:hypothetical protein [Luteipulveratus halotolerans]KNX38841.1 hypothetical protein VV01_19605 [Luteipulveratus halotolerans]